METIYRIIEFVKSKVDGLDVKIIESDMFAYIYETDEIFITEEYDDVDIAWEVFMVGYLKDEFDLKITANEMTVYSILHEIGHYKTKIMIDVDKYIEEISEIPEGDFLQYRKCFAEYVADDWAVAFINEFPEVLKIK